MSPDKPAQTDVAAAPSPLDRRAEQLEARADAAEEKAASVASEARRAAERAEDEGQPRAARCKVCRSRMERYEGQNPHKQGTRYCPGCGVRYPIED